MFSEWDDASVGLRVELLRGIYGNGFDHPSTIQKQTLPLITSGRDLVAQAQSGTGKTGAFCVGVLQRLDLSAGTQAIILAPTRELSGQIKSVFDKLGTFMKTESVLLVGGAPMDRTVQQVRENPHALIGCPGRTLDILNRGLVDTTKIKMIVLDEADEMLSQGFRDQLHQIFQHLTSEAQVLMFSATMSESLQSTIGKIMNNPEQILITADQLTLEGIAQHYITVANDQVKFEIVKDLYASVAVSQSIIYCNSVKRVQDLYEAMKNDGFPVCCMHSDMDRITRTDTYDEFKAGKHRMLISSDITSRGIDIQQVSIVINFDLPKGVDTYLHRIGRSGRWGRKGTAINLVSKFDREKMEEIQRHYKITLTEFTSF